MSNSRATVDARAPPRVGGSRRRKPTDRPRALHSATPLRAPVDYEVNLAACPPPDLVLGDRSSTHRCLAILEQRFETDEVLMHGVPWIRAEHPRDGVPRRAQRRRVAHLDVDAGAGVLRIETHASGVADRSAFHRLPRDERRLYARGFVRLPRDRKAAGPGDRPARPGVVEPFHAPDVAHELGEPLVVTPEIED